MVVVVCYNRISPCEISMRCALYSGNKCSVTVRYVATYYLGKSTKHHIESLKAYNEILVIKYQCKLI